MPLGYTTCWATQNAEPDSTEIENQHCERLIASCLHTILQLRLLQKYSHSDKANLLAHFARGKQHASAVFSAPASLRAGTLLFVDLQQRNSAWLFTVQAEMHVVFDAINLLCPWVATEGGGCLRCRWGRGYKSLQDLLHPLVLYLLL